MMPLHQKEKNILKILKIPTSPQINQKRKNTKKQSTPSSEKATASPPVLAPTTVPAPPLGKKKNKKRKADPSPGPPQADASATAPPAEPASAPAAPAAPAEAKTKKGKKGKKASGTGATTASGTGATTPNATPANNPKDGPPANDPKNGEKQSALQRLIQLATKGLQAQQSEGQGQAGATQGNPESTTPDKPSDVTPSPNTGTTPGPNSGTNAGDTCPETTKARDRTKMNKYLLDCKDGTLSDAVIDLVNSKNRDDKTLTINDLYTRKNGDMVMYL